MHLGHILKTLKICQTDFVSVKITQAPTFRYS